MTAPGPRRRLIFPFVRTSRAIARERRASRPTHFATLAQVFDIYCEFGILTDFVKPRLRDSHAVRKLLVSAAAEGFWWAVLAVPRKGKHMSRTVTQL